MDFSAVIKDRIISSTAVGGGDIGSSFRVVTVGGEYFVKHYSVPGTSAAETAGLKAMSATGAVTVPEVVVHDEHFIVLQYITQEPRCPEFQMLLEHADREFHRRAVRCRAVPLCWGRGIWLSLFLTGVL